MLGKTLDAERIEANYEGGVLTVAIPVAEQAKPRRIELRLGSGPQGTLDLCRLTAHILCPEERLGLPGAVPPLGPHHSSDIWYVHIDPPAPQEFDTVTTLDPLFCDPEYEQTRRTPVGGRMQTLVPGDSATLLLYRPSQ